jgi:ABC-type dipeptide/oligopeptide/nickel transport system permease subunit
LRVIDDQLTRAGAAAPQPTLLLGGENRGPDVFARFIVFGYELAIAVAVNTAPAEIIDGNVHLVEAGAHHVSGALQLIAINQANMPSAKILIAALTHMGIDGIAELRRNQCDAHP